MSRVSSCDGAGFAEINVAASTERKIQYLEVYLKIAQLGV